jgi:hypothetical protein
MLSAVTILSGQIYDPNSARQITAGVADPKTGLTGYENRIH